MTTLYGVTTGEYSDYRVRALFSTRAKAEVYALGLSGRCYYDSADIEEFELDPEPNDYVIAFKRSGDALFNFTMEAYTGNSRYWMKDYAPEKDEEFGYGTVKVDVWGYYSDRALVKDPDTPKLSGTVRASSEEEAAKIANEYRQRFMAQPESAELIEAARYKKPVSIVDRLTIGSWYKLPNN